MFKFNKNTHLTILATFAIVFIVIYLYFTITDLRKLQGEVTRLRQKVAALEGGSCPVAGAIAGSASSGGAPPPSAPPAAVESVVTLAKFEEAVQKDDDDDNSVLTDEIKKMLDDDVEDNEAEVKVESSQPAEVEPTVVAPEVVESASPKVDLQDLEEFIKNAPEEKPGEEKPKTAAPRARKPKTTK